MCKRSAWRVIRISWISRLYLKVLSNEWDSLLLTKSYMNNEDWYSYKSFSFKILDCLNRGSVWLLYFALFIVWTARFCSNSVLCTTDWQVLPHAKIPYMRCGWMSAKYSVLRLSTGKICLTCLMENKAWDILLLMSLKWYFHVWCSSSRYPKIWSIFLLTANQFFVI